MIPMFSMNMTALERWTLFYQYGWATKEDVAEAVRLGGLTPEDYETIVGEPYPAP